MSRITIPYAVADFAQLREKGYYYVDKTMFIPRLENYNAPVFLRPRRFGKSLLVSTLAYYYDCNEKERFQSLFGGTWIGANPTEEHNQYMVLRFDFSTMLVADNIPQLQENFNKLNCGILRDFVRSPYRYAPLFSDFTFSDEKDVTSMLEDVLRYSLSHRLPKIYILIDEYDNFANQLLTSYKDPIYEEVTTADSFFRTFFKIIKKGIGEGSVRSCFCTGVLPVTMDDLTSGYNIAETLTLKPDFMEMLGFNHSEAEKYLRYVLKKYGNSEEQFDEIWQLIISNYDGYRFLPDANLMFNATILTYFFKNIAETTGEIPEEMVDENLRTDINWIRRLTLSLDNAKEMLDALVIDNELIYNLPDLRSKFNKQKFFDKKFYPISLYYLGMVTIKDKFKMTLPNLTMRSIYLDYYNQINQISSDAIRYVPAYEQFTKDRQLEPLIFNYFEQYLGQFPAQVFDKVNENFIRCSFFELCSRYLSDSYTFALEQNHPAGRSDLEMNGIPGTDYHNDCRLIEFKYFKAGEAKKVATLTEARPEEINQVKEYAAGINQKFPNYRIRTYVAYFAAGKECKCWEIS